MSDEADIAAEISTRALERQIAAARAPIAAGAPGECSECGRDMPRLVGGRCGYCRDGRRR